VILPYVAPAPAPPPSAEPLPPCEKDCWLLSRLALRGQVDGTITFELQGEVRAREEQKIPLFGPPGQVRLDDVTIDGARASVGMEGENYVLFTSKRAFTVRGKIALGRDWLLSVPGPVLTFDAALTKGKVVEGDRLSGLASTVIHFDPMIEGQVAPTVANKPRPAFMVRRTLRFTGEPAFSYRVVVQGPDDLGTVRFPLKNGEKVQAVDGATGFRIEADAVAFDVTGTQADVTVTGSLGKLPPIAQLVMSPDERSAYEWWLVESDPEHRVTVGGDAKLVDIPQTNLTPTLPNARGYLLQRGQRAELEARSLVRGDVLAAVARSNKRFVAVTGRGEIVSDESLTVDNHGLELLPFTPVGKAVYLSTDGSAQRILHAEAGARDVLVAARPGSHDVRVQSLAEARLTPLVGALAIPTSRYPLTTSRTEITIGLPGDVHPLAVLGGDHALLGLGSVDAIAMAVGVALACFGFRTRRTRALGAVVTAGLWLVSRDAFVVAAGGLFVAGAAFVASRFVRGTWLLAASANAAVLALLAGRAVLSPDVSLEPTTEMVVRAPTVPTAELSSAAGAAEETRTGTTPVSISMPSSERYVHTSLQLATPERPLAPRVLYVTSTMIGLLHLVWTCLLGLLALAHRDLLFAVKQRVASRLARRAGPRPVAEGLDAPIPEGSAPF
jgi:hypothetical protein